MAGDHVVGARDKIRNLLDRGHHDDPAAFTDRLVDPFALQPPHGWLWDGTAPHPATAFGLRDPRAYTHLIDAGRAAFLHQPMSAALGLTVSPTTAFTADQIIYVRRSADITMKGGTTSGVVYPLAVCEIARRFRLRNVGGASAGAIAASFAAAAEIGRAGEMNPATRGALGPVDTTQVTLPAGRTRPGFVGLADVAAWFTQADSAPGSADEFRIGQLFKPTTVARPLFRVIIAAMRSRYAQIPLLVTSAFGRWSMISTFAIIVLSPVLAADWRTGPDGVIASYPLAMAWLLALSLLIIGGIVLAALARSSGSRASVVPTDLAEPVRPPSTPPRPSLRVAIGAFGGGIVLAGLLSITADHWAHAGPWRMLLVWLIMVVAVVGVQLAAVHLLVSRARSHRFGLVSGANSDPVTPESTISRWWTRVWDWVAGAPRQTVEPNLMDWMNTILSDLAGLPDRQVLVFGHLWFGAGYTRDTPYAEPSRADAADDARRRLVNLELMTSELVHGVSMRFPLPDEDVRTTDGDQLLYLRRSDLVDPNGMVLPQNVVDLLCAGPSRPARDATTGEWVELYPLPMPWDLPVVFAVRLSMALPALFQAVRLYRLETSHAVRDDFGAMITKSGLTMTYPPPGVVQEWVQELWMSDGGITSNFPIHFFDNVLPLWPTLGINLGRHPPGFGHQDVWLPGDAQARSSVPGRLGRSLLGFGAGVFRTAMSWRDTSQTFMPAYRGRVAWVRQRSEEGGSNLFMDRDRISALALRGAAAGARLSRRFAADSHWQRHQWLRLRVALGNLSSLESRAAVSMADSTYTEILDQGWSRITRVQADMDHVADPSPARPNGTAESALSWFEPPQGFWPDADAMITDLVSSPGADPRSELNTEVPLPAPELRQVPPN